MIWIEAGKQVWCDVRPQSRNLFGDEIRVEWRVVDEFKWPR